MFYCSQRRWSPAETVVSLALIFLICYFCGFTELLMQHFEEIKKTLSPIVIQRLLSQTSTRTCDHLKNITKPEKIPLEYWNNILNEAQNLKGKVRENNKESLKLLSTKHVTLLFIKPHGRFQIAYTLACDLLGARRTLICDSDFEKTPNLCDVGRVLSKLTDVVVAHGFHHDVLNQIVSTCDVPVIPASSDAHCLQKAMSDMMTFQEKFGKLEGLTMAWIGPPNSLFNSYMVLCSKFEINFRYALTCKFGSGRMSPVRQLRPPVHDKVEENAGTGFKEIEDAISGAHVIATSMHADESSKITLEVLKGADPNHVFMHSLPRTWKEVSVEVFNSDRNLSWITSENYLYIAMAFILSTLRN